ncbi:MAG: hypothetical protein QW134_09955 [Nitrososphaeria archaeon]
MAVYDFYCEGIWPDDADMQTVCSQKLKEIKLRRDSIKEENVKETK